MHSEISQVELLFRQLINFVLTNEVGPNWWRECVPGDIQEKAKLRIQTHLDRHRHVDRKEFDASIRRLEFCDVPDYPKILRQKSIREFFKRYIPSQSYFDAQLTFFEDFRNSIFHNRTLDEVSLALGEAATRSLVAVFTEALSASEGFGRAQQGAGSVASKSMVDEEKASTIDINESIQNSPSLGDFSPADEILVDHIETGLSHDYILRRTILSPKEKLLVDRLQDSMNFNARLTAREILSIDEEEFANSQGIGAGLVGSLLALKERLGREIDLLSTQEDLSSLSGASLLPARYRLDAAYFLREIAMSTEEQKAVRKLIATYEEGDEITADGILQADIDDFKNKPGVGEKTIEALCALQEKIVSEAMILDSKDYIGLSSNELLVPVDFRSLEPQDIEGLLLDDVEDFLSNLPDRKVKIAKDRWAYEQSSQMTLDSLGKMFGGLSRERVRQIEADINRGFVRSLRTTPKVLLENIRDRLHSDLQVLMPSLRAKFPSPKLFFAFLELASDCQSNEIQSVQLLAGARSDLLEDYFSERESPVSDHEILDYLTNELEFSGVQAGHYIQDLANSGKLQFGLDGLSPGNMAKGPAIAHVLYCVPEGLHWSEIAEAVNRNGYAKKKFSTERPDPELLRSPHVYLSGIGSYRHIRFLELSEELVKDSTKFVSEYLGDQKRQTAALQEIFRSIPSDLDLDYFTLRFICTEYGEDFGIHGTYRSRVDTVSLRESHTTIPTHQYVFEELSGSEVPMTFEDIRNRLRNPTLGWAKLLMDQLSKKGKVIAVEKDRFMTHEGAQNFARSEGVIAELAKAKEYLDDSAPLSAYRDLVNEELGTHYTKGFVSLALEASD